MKSPRESTHRVIQVNMSNSDLILNNKTGFELRSFTVVILKDHSFNAYAVYTNFEVNSWP